MEASAPSAPIALALPYFTSRKFTAKFTTAAPACTAKLARPSDRIARMIFAWGRMQCKCSLSGAPFVKMKNHNTETHDAAWPISVA